MRSNRLEKPSLFVRLSLALFLVTTAGAAQENPHGMGAAASAAPAGSSTTGAIAYAPKDRQRLSRANNDRHAVPCHAVSWLRIQGALELTDDDLDTKHPP